ncbi:hypothetical protein ACFW9D_12470 [Streptomyces sp. NPDC059524]|uniref:hypothetical protein n=1 Tax=Streptomyces sp. NPDC059524 TaxID=3346856 RepID=UPI0036C87364
MTRNTAVAAAAFAAAVGLSVSSASATAQAGYVVSPGGAFEANAVNPTLTVPGATLTCDTSHAAGTLQTASADGVGIGDINSIDFAGCNVNGIDFDVSPSALPWKINVTGMSSTTRADGTITGIVAQITGFGCEATFAGSVTGWYENGANILHVTGGGSLAAQDDANCLGLINPGDHAEFLGDYQLTSAQTISQG